MITKRDQIKMGRELQKRREAAGMPVSQLAWLLDVTTRTVENWESGATKTPKAVRLWYARLDQLQASGLVTPDSACKQLTLFGCHESMFETWDITDFIPWGELAGSFAPLAA